MITQKENHWANYTQKSECQNIYDGYILYIKLVEVQ